MNAEHRASGRATSSAGRKPPGRRAMPIMIVTSIASLAMAGVAVGARSFSLCSCDIWYCGFDSPLTLDEGGRGLTATGAVYGEGEVNVPVRVKLAQESSGAVAEKRTVIEGSYPDEGMSRIPWSIQLTSRHGAAFKPGLARGDVWLSLPGNEVRHWEADVELTSSGVLTGASEPSAGPDRSVVDSSSADGGIPAWVIVIAAAGAAAAAGGAGLLVGRHRAEGPAS